MDMEGSRQVGWVQDLDSLVKEANGKCRLPLVHSPAAGIIPSGSAPVETAPWIAGSARLPPAECVC